MLFLDGVRAAIRRAAARRDPWPPLERVVDGAALRIELRRVVDGLPGANDRVRAANLWSGSAFEQFLEWLLPQLLSLDLGKPAEELQQIVGVCLRAFVAEASVVGLAPSTTAEIEAIRRGFRLRLSPSGEAEIVAPWRVPILYAEHLGLVRSGVMMPAGQLLLSLADQGARRWLLTLEVHQSLGTDDPWRLPRSHLVPKVVRGGRLLHPHCGDRTRGARVSGARVWRATRMTWSSSISGFLALPRPKPGSTWSRRQPAALVGAPK